MSSRVSDARRRLKRDCPRACSARERLDSSGDTFETSVVAEVSKETTGASTILVAACPWFALLLSHEVFPCI
jgi:hypothetical protein